jgi:hypothetical protein
MSYRFQAHHQYLMPTHFGPMSGPRQGPDGRRFPIPDGRTKDTFTVSFLTDRACLERHLPSGFELDGEPVVTVSYASMTHLDWLAGRGYNTLGVTAPARWRATGAAASGPFLFVLWENLPDAILTGREQLGFSKLWAELPGAQHDSPDAAGSHRLSALWLGHEFLRLEVDGLTAASPPDAPAAGGDARGTLHLRYLPNAGAIDTPLVTEAVLTPAAPHLETIECFERGAGRVEFLATRWRDMPTQAHIVRALRALPQLEPRGATRVRVRGGGDLLDHRVLERR